MSRDCPNPGDSNRGGGRGGGRGGRGGGCFKCNQEGHRARDCPNADGGQKGDQFGGSAFGSSFGTSSFSSNNANSNDWDNADSQTGFGGSASFGAKSSFGSNTFGSSGGFGASDSFPNDSDEPKFGGFGGTRRGGGGGDRSGGDRKGCFKCGEEGHFSRECPNAGSAGDGGRSGGDKKSGCFNCGEDGHLSRDCPNPPAEGKEVRKVVSYIPPPPPEGEDSLFESVAKGINFSRYDEIMVECTGDNAPSKGLMSFDEADIDDIFKENVRKSKYEKPTPVQKWAIPVILSGRDVMGCAQTGSGKTAAFLLPVLSEMRRSGIQGSSFSEIQEPQALIVGPTRELVVQIYNEARKFSCNTMIRPAVLYGGVSVSYQLSKIDEGAHVLVGTPGRLLDIIKRKKISLAKVKYFILDEADRMLDLGFKDAMMDLAKQSGMPPDHQTLMFSATFPEQIQELARELLKNYIFITVGRVGGANWDIKQFVYQVSQNEKRDKLVSILNEGGNERTLVFVEQKRQADFIASFLSQSSFPTTSIHGDREQREREEALRDFKTGTAPILVATSVAARGLDIANVSHVVNYDMPSSIDEYVHRIGRTGRCGNVGKATSFFNADTDKEMARALVKVLSEAQQDVPGWLEEMSESSYGAGGFMSGNYGSRDTRRGKFGGSGNHGGFSDNPGASRVFGGAPVPAADDEEW